MFCVPRHMLLGYQINQNETDGACGKYGGEERTGTHRVLDRKRDGKRQLGRSGRKWEDNIKIYIQEMGRESSDWIDLAQNKDRWWDVVKTVMNLPVT